MARRGRRWMGTARVLLRTRRARRRRDPGAALRALARGGTDAVGLRIRGQHVLLLLEPRLADELLAGHAADTVKGPGLQRAKGMLGDGLLSSEGAAHDRARRLVAPAFSPRRLTGYNPVFTEYTRDCTAAWADGERLDLSAEMAALTLRIAGQTLLGTDLSAQAPRVRTNLEAALEEFAGAGRDPDAAARAALHGLVDDILEQRAGTTSDDRGDVISALLGQTAVPGGLTAGEVHDHVLTLLLAGHETTANALTWTLYLLARHPGVQERLRAEVSSLLGGRAPAAGDLPSLGYTRAVIAEGMRCYPPAWVIGRTLTADLSLAGWRLPAGSIAVASPLLMHHDPRWFAEPEAFDPDRWGDDRRRAIPHHAYLPFGTGPRACIGEQFAWAEMVTVLAMLAQSWTFGVDPGFSPTPSYRITLRPGVMPLTVRRAS
jgi:cytochrome P450